MDRRIRILLIVVVVVALAYPAAAWMIGMSVEHQWQEREQYALQQFPYIGIVKRDYRRGVYNSTEEVTYSMSGVLAGNLHAAGLAPAPEHAQVTVRTTIHHGPLPQMRAFAPATADTEIVLPPEARQTLAAAFGSQAGMTIHTRMKWLGGATTVVQSSAFQHQDPKGESIDWRGLDARIDLGREIGAGTLELTAPGVTVKSPEVNLSFENLKLSSAVQPAFEVLTVGTVHVSLGRVDIEQPAKSIKASMHNFTIDTKGSVDGEYVSSDGTIVMDALEAGKFAASRLVLEVRFDHLHGPSMAAVVKTVRANERDITVNSAPADSVARMAEAFKTSGTDILTHAPVLELPRIGFTTPDGELLMSMKASMPGVTRSDIDVPPQLLGASLVKHLQASLDVRIDTALLDRLLDSTGKGDTIAAQMQGLQRQGYLKLDGKALTTHLTFQSGRLKVNDLPFPPMPAAGPGAPGATDGPGAPGVPGAPGRPRTPPH